MEDSKVEKMETEQQAGLGLVAQYLKDLSFENFYNSGVELDYSQAPTLDLNCKIDHQQLDSGLNEVNLNLKLNVVQGDYKLFLVDLQYVGVFSLENFPAEMIRPVLFIECPKIIYPFARAIVSQVVQNAELPMPLLPLIDFAAMYLHNNRSDKSEENV